MSLRVRLLLGYGYLVALLLLAAGGAMLGFLDLSAGIDVILEENFTSIEACMRMIEALERQDSATLAGLIEGDARAEELAGFEGEFRDALATARGNLTEEAEGPIVAAIGEGFDAYRRERDALLAERPDRPLAAYRSRVLPRFETVKGDVLRLLAVNQQAMIEADRAAREKALSSGAWLGFLATVALLSLILLSRALQRQVLSRLTGLKEEVAAIAHADPVRRLRERGGDELTAVARGVNRILDRRQELESRLQGRLAQERRLVLGLVGHLGPGTTLHDLSGELLAGDRGAGGEAAEEWLRTEGRRLLVEASGSGGQVHEEIDLGGGRAAVHLLTAGAGRPVGWLVRKEGETAGA